MPGRLTENDKEPYIEASKLDKERYIRERLLMNSIRTKKLQQIQTCTGVWSRV
uniref:2-deoxyglucose-6-phosphate phosphatase n=1 Tax=Solanum tuberosum TaxID=4113 RepID=M0ZSP9_SOLTU